MLISGRPRRQVGDAYIVAGILPMSVGDDDAAAAGGGSVGGTVATPRAAVREADRSGRTVCARMLRLGAVLLDGMAACRRETGLDVHGRVGVAIGSAVLGALGKLQPRFHMMGQVRY